MVLTWMSCCKLRWQRVSPKSLPRWYRKRSVNKMRINFIPNEMNGKNKEYIVCMNGFGYLKKRQSFIRSAYWLLFHLNSIRNVQWSFWAMKTEFIFFTLFTQEKNHKYNDESLTNLLFNAIAMNSFFWRKNF